MKKRILGSVNPLEVSAVGYGCMGFSRGYGKCPDSETAIGLMRAAYERGCTFFDTAQSYADGENEKLVGEAVKPFRGEIVLATKIHIPEEAKNNLGQVLESRLDASLRRLGTDYVDIFYQHRMNKSISAEEVAYEMGRLIAKGKICGYGQSQSTADEIIRANAVTPMTAVQNEYSIMERSFEKEVIPTCERLGIGFVAFSPMASGYLGGKATAPNDAYKGDDVRRVITRYSPENVRANLPLLDALYGSEGLFLGSAFIMVNNLLLWTYGVGQLSRDVPRAERLRNTFINPGVISNLIGLFCFLTPFKLPVVPATAVSYLASLNTPIAMIAVGAFLAQCDLRECFRDTQVYFVSALRLLILPLITLAVFLLLPLDHTLRCSMLISAAAPVAMAASLFGKTYGTDYLFSTRATAVSTIFSALTIPAMVALCQLLGG